MTVLADLHTHSTASDGQYAPAALVEKAAAAGIQVLAVTDHDTIDGAEEAVQAGHGPGPYSAARRGAGGGRGPAHAHTRPAPRPGVPRPDSALPQAACQPGRAGSSASWTFSGKRAWMCLWRKWRRWQAAGVVARPHFAQVMLRRGYVTSLREAFDRYLDSDEYSASNAGRPAPRSASPPSTAPAAGPCWHTLTSWAMRMIDWRRPSVPCGRRGSTVWSASIPVIPRDRLPPICVLRKNMGSISQRAAISTGKPSVRTPD